VNAVTRDDAGFATVWAAGAVMALVTLLVFGMHLAAATSGRHRAEAAADLGALAGAVHAVDGEPVACAYAARVARRMATRLVSCRTVGWEVFVAVEVEPALALPGTGVARGRARAGPAEG
jgi:secretion/DNA translocation related TadE-like protein